MPRLLRSLPLSQIDCAPQVRETFDAERLAELARSLATVKLQQPILVRPTGERWIVIDGERRLRAAKIAGWECIDALIDDDDVSASQRVAQQLVANCQRADLTPLETARAIERLMRETPCTAAEAASTLGLSAATVSRLLALLDLPEAVQQQVHAGTLPASTAYAIAKTKDTRRRGELIAAASKGELRRDVASGRERAPKKQAATIERERIRIPVGDACSVVVSGRHLNRETLLELLERACAELRALPPVGGDGASLIEALAGKHGHAKPSLSVTPTRRRARATKASEKGN